MKFLKRLYTRRQLDKPTCLRTYRVKIYESIHTNVEVSLRYDDDDDDHIRSK